MEQYGFEWLGWLMVSAALAGIVVAGWVRLRRVRLRPVELEVVPDADRHLELDEFFSDLQLRLEAQGFSFRSYARQTGPWDGPPLPRVIFEHPATRTWALAGPVAVGLSDEGIELAVWTRLDGSWKRTRAAVGVDLDRGPVPEVFEESIASHLADLPTYGEAVSVDDVLRAAQAPSRAWWEQGLLTADGRLSLAGTLRMARRLWELRVGERRAHTARLERAAVGRPPLPSLPIRIEVREQRRLEALVGSAGIHRWRVWVMTGGALLVAGKLLPSLGVLSAVFLIGVLVLHELGHVVVMKGLRAWDPQVFFVPGLDRLGQPPEHKPSVPVRMAVRLAGPIPGLVMGVFLFQRIHPGMDPELAVRVWKAAVLLFLVNGLHLMPFIGLDGGAIATDLWLRRSRFAATLAYGLPGLLLLGAGLSLRDVVLALLGAVLLGGWVTWRRAHRLAAAADPWLDDPEARRAGLVDALRVLRGRIPAYPKLRLVGAAEYLLDRPPAPARLAVSGTAVFLAVLLAAGAGVRAQAPNLAPEEMFPPDQVWSTFDLTGAHVNALARPGAVGGLYAGRFDSAEGLAEYSSSRTLPLAFAGRTALFSFRIDDVAEADDGVMRAAALQVARDDLQALWSPLREAADPAQLWAPALEVPGRAWLRCRTGTASATARQVRALRGTAPLLDFSVPPPWDDPEIDSRVRAARRQVAGALEALEQIRDQRAAWLDRVRLKLLPDAWSGVDALLAQDRQRLDAWAQVQGIEDGEGYRAFRTWLEVAEQVGDARDELRALQDILHARPGAPEAAFVWPFERVIFHDQTLEAELWDLTDETALATAIEYLSPRCRPLELRFGN